MSKQMPALIELSDDELLAVSGGRCCVSAGVAQAIQQGATVIQQGGSISGSGTVIETLIAVITQVASNVNTGSININVVIAAAE